MSRGTRTAGFTLVELVMVIVMVGVLAAIAVPRLMNSGDVSTRGLHDATLAYLRYAQKTAVAQRRTVCVTFSANGLSLSMASAAGSYTCGASPVLAGPRGETPAQLSGTHGAAYSPQPSNFNFDGLGQPVNGTGATLGAQTIQVAGLPSTVTVETLSGLVHD